MHEARAEIELVAIAVRDVVVNFLEMAQVGGEIDVHVTDEIRLRGAPGSLQGEAEATLADVEITNVAVARRQRLPDLCRTVGRAVVRNAELVDLELVLLAKCNGALNRALEHGLLVEDREGDMNAGRLAHDRSCSVVSQQDFDYALRLIRNQRDGVLGVAKRKRGAENATRRDRAGGKVLDHLLLQILGVERGRSAHWIVPGESR